MCFGLFRLSLFEMNIREDVELRYNSLFIQGNNVSEVLLSEGSYLSNLTWLPLDCMLFLFTFVII